MSDAPERITVATYNIHGGVGTDGRFDLGRVLDVVRELEADVVALQEVGDVRGRHSAADQAETIAAELGLTLLYQPTMLRGDRRYGNAIVTRLPVDGSRSYDLSVRRREPRGCLRADLRLGDRLLHVFGLHLGLSLVEQRRQATMLLGADILRDAAVAWPLIVMGDFNTWFAPRLARVIRQALTDAAIVCDGARPTYPSRRPFLRLDRIYVDGAWSVDEVFPHATPLARRASDHLPLVARLRLRPAEAATLPMGAERGALATPEGAVPGRGAAT